MLFPGGPVPQVLIMQRGSAFGSRRPRLSLVGGYAERSDLARGGAPAPWRAALREIREETALALPSDTLRFLGLCRGAGDGTPSLSGVIALDAAPTDHHLVPADPREVAGYEYWPFEPERLAHLLQQRGGWAALVPLSAAALVHALADHYGDDAVTPLRRVHG